MAETKTIEIDLDVHKLIESSRETFSEPPNTVLRRLLELGESGSPQPQRDPSRGAWTGKGVLLPDGTELRMQYRGQEHRGVIRDSVWLIEGRRFNSPSAAAGGVARTKDGRRPSLDGWKYWHVKRPGDPGWRALDSLRARHAHA